jgi:hypothetical protein
MDRWDGWDEWDGWMDRERERERENGVACASNYDLYSIMQFATGLMTDCFIGHMNTNSDHIWHAAIEAHSQSCRKQG